VKELIAMFAVALCVAPSLRPQTPEENKFTIRVTAIKRDTGCTVKATSEKVRYELTSKVSASCAMLVAGEEYKAYRATAANDPKNESKDTTVLIVLNNVGNKRRANAVFDIASEQILNSKPCPKEDPLGLYAADSCQPLPPKRDKQ